MTEGALYGTEERTDYSINGAGYPCGKNVKLTSCFNHL